MTIVTTMTEAELKSYAHRALGPMAAMLGFTIDGGSYDQVMADALLEYGVTDADEIEGITEVRLGYACMRLELWRYLTDYTSTRFNLSDAGTSLSLEQIHNHARKNMESAQARVDRLRADLAIETAEASDEEVFAVTDVTRADDPYEALATQAAEDEEDFVDDSVEYG